MPDRLNDDQRLLFTVLREVWHGEARRAIMVFAMCSVILTGVTIGVLITTRNTIRQTAEITDGIQRQVNFNRDMLRNRDDDRNQQVRIYQALMSRLNILERELKRQGRGR